MPLRYRVFYIIFIENAKICLNFSYFFFFSFSNSLCYTIFLLNWNWVALIGYGRTTTATILVIQFSNIHYSSTHKKKGLVCLIEYMWNLSWNWNISFGYINRNWIFHAEYKRHYYMHIHIYISVHILPSQSTCNTEMNIQNDKRWNQIKLKNNQL